MDKVYLICDKTDAKAASIDSAPHIGVEHMGTCTGRAIHESGVVMSSHTSSSFGWLRKDLICKLNNPAGYKIIDLIGKPVPSEVIDIIREANNGK